MCWFSWTYWEWPKELKKKKNAFRKLFFGGEGIMKLLGVGEFLSSCNLFRILNEKVQFKILH